MTKVIQCPCCDNELTEKTAKFKPLNNKQAFKMQCGICHHTWKASLDDFYTIETPASAPDQYLVCEKGPDAG